MKSRSINFDLIRTIAALLVVAIHVDTITASLNNYLGGVSWWLANFVNTLGRAAVPLFVMLSGALLLNSTHSSFYEIIRRSWRRLIFPGIIWIALYFWWQNRWHGGTYNIGNVGPSVLSNAVGHLYYLAVALGLYLATPWLIKLSHLLSVKHIVAGLVLSASLSFMIFRYPSLAFLNSFLLYWIMFIPYFLLGSTLKNNRVNGSNRIYLICLIMLMVATGGYLNYLGHLSVIHSGQPWWFNLSVGNFFWDSFSPTNIVLTVSLFLRLNSLNLSRLPHILTNLVTRLAMSSYGIYLVHPFIIDLLDHYANLSVHLVTGNLWEFYLFKVALTFMLSWILVEAIRLLRLANLFFGEK